MPTRLFESGATDVLYLVDLSGYVFRAYHAIAPLTSPSGEPTQAVFGTVNMLERLVRQCKPHRLAVAMDSQTRTFRKEIFADYKANRPAPPEDLKQQMRRVGQVIRAFPIPCYQADGFEADDLIASVVKRCRETKTRVVIVSADKDLMQLVGDDVVLWDTLRDKVFGVEEVRERFGLEISQVRDALALMGDSSDNVPGVPSVGPKTAKDLLLQFGDLDGIYAHLDDIKAKKLRETLAQNEAQARLSQQLVTLKSDLALDPEPQNLVFERRYSAELRALYTELGFTRQLAALPSADELSAEPAVSGRGATSSSRPPESRAPAAASFVPTPKVDVVTSPEQLQRLAAEIRAAGHCALLPWLLGPATLTAEWIGLGVAVNASQAYYLPLAHRSLIGAQRLDLEALRSCLVALLTGPNPVRVTAYDSKALLVVLQQRGVPLERCHFDVLLASYLLDSGANTAIERIVQSSLDVELPSFEALFKRKGNRLVPADELSVEEAAEFVGRRVALLPLLAERLQSQLEEDTLKTLYDDVELPLTPLLSQLEQTGVLLDTSVLAELAGYVDDKLQGLEKQAQALVSTEFNVHSPRQLEKLLFDDLKLKPIKRTKTSRSTDAETLEALSDQHPLPGLVLEIRQLAKLKGTYIDALPSLVNPKTGRLHTRWHQDVTATGRLSSSDPNLQNIPIRTELGQRIRAAFVAPAGTLLLSADYSQIELRVLAHLSKDPVLLDAFRTEQDIHQRTAMEIFEVDAEDVTPEMRRQAKAVNFGVIYGQGDSALGKSLGISRIEAGQFIAAYFRRYQGVTTFMQATLEVARASGSVRTLFGRRRLVPDILHSNRARRLAAERIAMNTPIQGTAADIMKKAMLALATAPSAHARMILTVHDELVFEVPVDEVDQAKARLRQAMQDVVQLDVPLVVEVGSGPNWRTAH